MPATKKINALPFAATLLRSFSGELFLHIITSLNKKYVLKLMKHM